MGLFGRSLTGPGLAISLALLLLSGCASTPYAPPQDARWGKQAKLLPSVSRLRNAAVKAATAPATWVPLLGAGLISIGDADENLSEWAARERPLFGSNADEVSDRLRDAATATYFLTGLLAPSGDDWVANKLRGFSVGLSAQLVTGGITEGLKSAVGRTRPSGANTRSFPSGHSSLTATRTKLAQHNLSYLQIPRWSRRVAGGGLHAISAATAWARVEGENHFVSDVLVGISLGNFVARFMQEAFLQAGVKNFQVSFEAAPGGGALQIRRTLR